MGGHEQQRLPAALSPTERHFYLELRRLVDIAGLTCRALEILTSSDKSPAGDSCFYSKSQWGRWLNAQFRPPRKAIRKLAEKLAEQGINARHLLGLWDKAFAPIPDVAATESILVRPRQLPAAVAHFTGRAAELDALSGFAAEVTAARGPMIISAISGTAGIGKTALAVHWAHQVAPKFGDGQLYVNLRGYHPTGSPVSPAEAICGFLDALAVPVDRIPATLDAQAALYRSLLSGRRMLILLDNARDGAQVRPMLPGSPGCLVLVTSRSQLTGLAAAEGARLLTLEVLAIDEARALLARRLGNQKVTAEPAAVAELIALCAQLPLALNIAAAHAVASPAEPLLSLVAGLRDRRERLDALDAGEPASSVRAVLSWSYQNLSPQSARMFRLLGIHPGPDITACAAASLAGISSDQARRALAELTATHLLSGQPHGRFAFDDLLRAYAAEQATARDPRPPDPRLRVRAPRPPCRRA
jgi:hypothetical protein